MVVAEQPVAGILATDPAVGEKPLAERHHLRLQ